MKGRMREFNGILVSEKIVSLFDLEFRSYLSIFHFKIFHVFFYIALVAIVKLNCK